MSIVNKVKSLGARAVMAEGDVRALLEKDHDEARELAHRMCEASGAARRTALLARLKPALTAHSRAEERAVYNALLQVRQAEPPRTLAQEGYVEHGLVDQLLAKLAASDAGTEVWLAHAKVLRELLEHHIEEEQSDIFAELGNYFSREELAELGVRFQREKLAILRGTASLQQRTAPARSRAKPAKPAATRARKSTARRAGGAKARTPPTARKRARAKR